MMLREMDLACRKPLETMCHTLHLNKPFKSYINKTFVADILDFRFLCIYCKIFARLSTQAVLVGICRDDFHDDFNMLQYGILWWEYGIRMVWYGNIIPVYNSLTLQYHIWMSGYYILMSGYHILIAGYEIWISGCDIFKSAWGIIISGYDHLSSRCGNNMTWDCTL